MTQERKETMLELHTNIWPGDQALYGARYILKAGRRYEVAIKRDAYDFQSNAKVSIWDGDKWNLVYSAPITDFPVARTNYTAREGTWESGMRDSLSSLFDIAITILEG